MKKKERIKAILMASITEGFLAAKIEQESNRKQERVIRTSADVTPCLEEVYSELATYLNFIYALYKHNPGPEDAENEDDSTTHVCYTFGKKVGMLSLEGKHDLVYNKHVVFSFLSESIQAYFQYPIDPHDGL